MYSLFYESGTKSVRHHRSKQEWNLF